MDLVANGDRQEFKRISTIQQWVVCLNTYTSVMLVCHPQHVQDLLTYICIHHHEGKPGLRTYPLATLQQPLSEGSCCVQADRLVSSECVPVDLVFKSASLSREGSKSLAVIPSCREVDGQKEAPTQQSGGAMHAAGTSHTLHACQSARTGTSNTAQRHHAHSDMFVSSATLCSTTAGTAPADGPLVPETNLPSHQRNPFSTLA